MNKCRKIIIGLEIKIRKREREREKRPQNCKSPIQRQRFMTTIKNVTEEKGKKKAQKLNWISYY